MVFKTPRDLVSSPPLYSTLLLAHIYQTQRFFKKFIILSLKYVKFASASWFCTGPAKLFLNRFSPGWVWAPVLPFQTVLVCLSVLAFPHAFHYPISLWTQHSSLTGIMIFSYPLICLPICIHWNLPTLLDSKSCLFCYPSAYTRVCFILDTQ